jgi:hypothetical protein
MAAVITPKAFEVFRIRAKVGNSGIDRPTRALHQPGKARRPTCRRGTFENEAKALLNQISKFAPAQCRLRLGSTVEIIWYFDSGFHWQAFP